MDFIKEVSGHVLVRIAHPNATYDCCLHDVDSGARNYVHLFNGMSGLHHREPGAVGAALTDSRTYAELICDGHHVHPVPHINYYEGSAVIDDIKLFVPKN